MDIFPESDLTTNLEWLLQSGEDDLALLSELIALDCAPLLLELGEALGCTAEQSEQLAVQAIAASALEAHRYRPDQSARGWVLGNFLQAAEKIPPEGQATGGGRLPSLTLPQHTAYLLQHRFGWPALEAARACGHETADIEQAEAAFAASNTRPAPAMARAGQVRSEASLQAIARRAGFQAAKIMRRRRLANRIKEGLVISATILLGAAVFWGAGRLPPDDGQAPAGEAPQQSQSPRPAVTTTPIWYENVSYVIHPGDTLSRIASLAGMPLNELRSLNGIQEPFMLRPGDPLWVRVPDGPPTEAPPSPAPNLSQLQPLDADSSLAEVRRRLREGRNFWRTLQAEYQLVTFLRRNQTPDEHQFYRFRVWISQPYYSSELFGGLSERPDLRHIIRYGRNYNQAVGFSGAYLDPRWDQPPDVLIYSPVLREMVFPDGPDLLVEGFGETTLLGEDRTAGRPSVMLEWRSPEGRISHRYWVDALSGILLRRQTYDPQRDFLVSDMIATSLLYDLRIAKDVFDPRLPWRSSFAADDRNRTVPFDEIVPLPTNAFSLDQNSEP